MRRLCVLFFILAGGISSLACQDFCQIYPEDSHCTGSYLVAEKDPGGPDFGLSQLADWEGLPVLNGDLKYKQFSSHTRAPENFPPQHLQANFDFSNFITKCGSPQPLITLLNVDHMDPQTGSMDPDCGLLMQGYLMAKHDGGPGYISRIWYTTPAMGEEVIRIYVDDFTHPVYVGKIADWGRLEQFPFSEPLAGEWSGARISYVPISFKNSMRVLLDRVNPLQLYYYHVDVITHERNTVSFNPYQFRTTAVHDDPLFSLDSIALTAPLQNIVLKGGQLTNVLNLSGPATLQNLQFSFPAETTLEKLQNLTIQFNWDGLDERGFEVSFASFFGLDFNPDSIQTLPIQVFRNAEEITVRVRFPMPFWESCNIRIVNKNPTSLPLELSYEKSDTIPEEPWGYFQAQFNEVDTTLRALEADELYKMFESNDGPGKFLGVILSMQGWQPIGDVIPNNEFYFLEGDEFGFIDGESDASIKGTGAEDFLNGAWYFLESPLSGLFSGVFAKHTDNQTGQITASRWNILADQINFNDSFEYYLEYGSPNVVEIIDHYRSVSFSYLAAP